MKKYYQTPTASAKRPTGARPHFILIAMLLLVNSSYGQLISLKTIPVATGDQFLLFPSQNLGMGGINISLTDSLLDHWINPAKGSQINTSQVSSSPVYYRIGNGYGDARSMPFALLWTQNDWFGGLSMALQAMNSANSQTPWSTDIRTLSGNMSENRYFSGFLGKRFANTSLGISAYQAKLSALDGVDLLYSDSEKIKQSGQIKDIRVGLSRKGLGGARQELLLLRNELDMTHKVTYQFWGWERFDERIETNLDHTITLGLHAGFTAPINTKGWQYGGIFTVNTKTHPKIPNYEIMNIPRDPGNTLAFNLGGGLSKRGGLNSFGIDFIYEPITSNTWAEADTHMINAEQELIRPGDKTMENDFEFSNWVLRTGLGWQNQNKGFQLGMQMRTIHYWLDQRDYIAVTDRKQEEYWVEWTTTWGMTLEYTDFTIRYSGRTTMGTGRPGVDTQWLWFGASEAVSASGDFIIAPSDALTLQEARVLTHQLSISLPIGN